jgi:hypothetical protein
MFHFQFIRHFAQKAIQRMQMRVERGENLEGEQQREKKKLFNLIINIHERKYTITCILIEYKLKETQTYTYNHM